MKDPNTAPLFYAVNLQKIEGDNQYTVDLHLPENFSYDSYHVVGNSAVISDILKVEITVYGAKSETPGPDNIKTISVNLEGYNFKYLKFKIVWKLSAGLGGGVGDPEDRETVGESVLAGVG
ncbi:MAG: hypothetical protein CMP12_05705 [Zunongwangia sp.]|jgi:hypothetical protein|nr:hypothetical protein [Zunongwangia sp.]|tara:strand:- start:123 stop:485 length:363 start_codon:yes stop_codon:yes gene_type:complete